MAVVGILIGLLVLFIIASIYQVNIDGKLAGERPVEVFGSIMLILLAGSIRQGKEWSFSIALLSSSFSLNSKRN